MSLSNSPPIKGYAWFVSPDPATATTTNPFGDAITTEGAVPGSIRLPEGIVDFMTLDQMTQGIDQTLKGHSFLVLSEHLEPPKVAQGWIVEPAHLEKNFQLEQRGSRWVRLRSLLHTEKTQWGDVQECEFEVVKG